MGNSIKLKNYCYLLILIFISLSVPFITTPKLVGEWERQHIYRNFYKKEGSKLKLHVVVRANTAAYTDKYGYGFLNASRKLIDLIKIQTNLRNIRILTVVYGALGILFFYLFASRWFGIDIGFLSASLIATNVNYLFFQNNLQPTIITFACIFFALERFQYSFDKEDRGRGITWPRIFLGLALSLLSLQYALGRLVFVFLTFCLFIDIFFDFKKLKTRNRSDIKTSFLGKLQILISYIVFLTIFDIRNVIHVFHPHFLNPPTSEHILNYADGVKTSLLWIAFGIKLFIKTYFLGVTEGTSLKELIPINVIYSSSPSLLMPKLATLFSLMGFYVLYKNITNYRYLFIFALFCLLFFIPTLSSNLFDYSHVGLMIFRSIYIIIPMSIICLLGLSKIIQIIEKKYNYSLKYVVHGLVIVICTWQLFN